jgi:hypothetical protein
MNGWERLDAYAAGAQSAGSAPAHANMQRQAAHAKQKASLHANMLPHLVHVLRYVAGQQVDSAAPRLVPAQRCVVLQAVAAAVHVHRQVAHVAGRVHALHQHSNEGR